PASARAFPAARSRGHTPRTVFGPVFAPENRRLIPTANLANLQAYFTHLPTPLGMTDVRVVSVCTMNADLEKITRSKSASGAENDRRPPNIFFTILEREVVQKSSSPQAVFERSPTGIAS
ncbi:MAG: hypothetical protein RLZZ245_1741, partial [Verrucomicrobiota bacterium]